MVQYRLGRRALKALKPESRRALAVFRALDFGQDEASARQLLAFAGNRDEGDPTVSERECNALAAALRDSGYPLTDDGIRAFKMERGFSTVVRISPAVASAYARLAEGREARLNVSGEQYESLPPEMRNALDILMRMGHSPSDLVAVRSLLGIRNAPGANSGEILVGTVSGEALLRWARFLGIALDDDSLRRLSEYVGGPVRGKFNDKVVAFLVDAILSPQEPVHNYERVTRGEVTLNKRTVAMLCDAKTDLGDTVRIGVMRGSYEAAAGGAHPHQGGGVIDLSVRPQSRSGIDETIRALREAGFAAWFRDRGDRPHVHAIAIGDREACASARWQLKSYFQGKDGRSRSQPDPHGDLDIEFPRWCRKYRAIALL